MAVALTIFALLIELMVGYPDRLLRAIGHPVTWMGRLIGALDHSLNRDAAGPVARRLAGILTVLIVIGAVGATTFLLERSLSLLPLAPFATAIVASALLAQRSLHSHVANVADALDQGGIAAGRNAVAQIVGRDTEALDAAGVARAAIESLAENFSDGVVAPALWMVIAGLPGAAIFKAINTADSMIGHRTTRYSAFGWAAARLDDLINLPASRLAALLIIAAAAMTTGASARNAWRAVRRDAHKHRSPNAGYPEAAMAGALGLMLAGPRFYDGIRVDDAMMGDGRRETNTDDIRAALKIYRCADAALIATVAVLAAALIVTGR